MFAVQVGILLLSLIITGPVYTACHVERASFTESLSIPLQQIACVVSNGRQLSAEQEMLIDDVVDTSLIPEYYNPVISDPIKALVSLQPCRCDHPESFKIFHPLDSARYFLPGRLSPGLYRSDKGYWFPAPAALRTNEGISPNEIGLSWPHLLRGQFPVKISEILLKLPDMLPVYGILWSIGAYFWLSCILPHIGFYTDSGGFSCSLYRLSELYLPCFWQLLSPPICATLIRSSLPRRFSLRCRIAVFKPPVCKNEMGNVVKLTKKV